MRIEGRDERKLCTYHQRFVFEPTTLLAVIPKTKDAMQLLQRCAAVKRSPMPSEANVPTIPEYYEAVTACLKEGGVDVDAKSLWIRAGLSHCDYLGH